MNQYFTKKDHRRSMFIRVCLIQCLLLNFIYGAVSITSIVPQSGVAGTHVRISGVGFSDTLSLNEITLDDQSVSLDSVTSNVLHFSIPTFLPGLYKVSVTSYESYSDTAYSLAIIPESYGETIFVQGSSVTSSVDSPVRIVCADIDNDGDLDIVSGSSNDDKVAWYENLDAQGTFGGQQIISIEADSPLSIYAADIDGDNYIDVLSSSNYDSKIAWYKNLDGQGTFGP